MKLSLALLTCTLILLVAVSAEAQTAPQPWKRYTVAQGDFSVELPTVPSMTTSSAFREKVNKTRWQITLGVYADGLVYEVDVYENLERQSLADFIREAPAYWAPDSVEQRNLLINGFAGKEQSAALTTSWFFATEGRLYRFNVRGGPKDDPRLKQFFSSIVLGANPDGIIVGDGPGVPFHADDPEAKLYTGKEVDQKIRLAIKPEPQYTEQAKQAGITGTVVLKAVFTSGGNVSNIRIVSGLPYGLTETAVAAAKNIKFFPAMKDGKNVSMWMQLEYNFNLY
jgi:TonB family protein